MKAIILVGGEGTRLRPLTINKLKGMVPMGGHPFLKYQFEFLKKHGVKEVVLSICHMPEKIKKVYGDGKKFGMKIHYAIEKNPLGTAGAMKNAEPFLTGKEPVVVMNGDVLTAIDLSKMLKQHKQKKAILSIGLTWVENPGAYGVVRFDKSRRIERFIEKPSPNERVSHWINAGIYLFDPAAFAYIPEGVNYSAERALFPGLLAGGQRVWAFPDRGYWNDIGTPKKYHQSNIDILEGRMFMLKVGKPYKRKSAIRIGDQVKIEPDVELVGPCVIGDKTKCRCGVVIGEATTIGKSVTINKHCKVDRSVIWDHVTIGEGTCLSGCVIGSHVKIGCHVTVKPGTVLADYAVIPDYSKL